MSMSGGNWEQRQHDHWSGHRARSETLDHPGAATGATAAISACWWAVKATPALVGDATAGDHWRHGSWWCYEPTAGVLEAGEVHDVAPLAVTL